MYVEWRALVGELPGVALEGQLTGAVEGFVGQGDESADRTHENDAPTPVLTKIPQRFVHDSHVAPEVGLELGFRILHGPEFAGSGDAPSGARDQRVNRAVLGDDVGHAFFG